MGIISFVLAGLGLGYYGVLGGEAMPWNVDVCLTAAPFFFGGYLYREKFAERCVRFAWSLFFLSAMLNLIFVTVNYKVFGEIFNMALNDYGMHLISLMAIITGIYCVYCISSKFQCRWIEYLGKNTMIYFAWHQTIALPLGLFVLNRIPYFNTDTLLSDAIRTVILFIFMIAFLFPFDRLIQNSKMRCIVGKNNKR